VGWANGRKTGMIRMKRGAGRRADRRDVQAVCVCGGGGGEGGRAGNAGAARTLAQQVGLEPLAELCDALLADE
jgi:hypothetical protein